MFVTYIHNLMTPKNKLTPFKNSHLSEIN